MSLLLLFASPTAETPATPGGSGTPANNKKRQKQFIFITDSPSGVSKGSTSKWDFDSITRQINGSAEVNILTDKGIDDYNDDDVDINNLVLIRVSSDKLGTQGLDYFSGYVSRKSIVSDGNQEQLRVRCFGFASKLFQATWRNGFTIAHDFTAGSTVTLIAKQIIDNYRTLVPRTRINYTTVSVENTGITVKDKYEGITFGEGLNKAIDLAYTVGRRWYWRILGSNTFELKRASIGADHSFTYKNDISYLSFSEDIINAVNEAFVYYANSTIKRYSDEGNIEINDYISNFSRETNVTDATTAAAIGQAIVEGMEPPILKFSITVNDKYYNGIETINPGDTCEILNIPSSLSDLVSGNMLITKTIYRKDEVELEIEINQVQVQASLEELRRKFEESRSEGIPSTFSNG